MALQVGESCEADSRAGGYVAFVLVAARGRAACDYADD